jgi:hypothetical protein
VGELGSRLVSQAGAVLAVMAQLQRLGRVYVFFVDDGTSTLYYIQAISWSRPPLYNVHHLSGMCLSLKSLTYVVCCLIGNLVQFWAFAWPYLYA